MTPAHSSLRPPPLPFTPIDTPPKDFQTVRFQIGDGIDTAIGWVWQGRCWYIGHVHTEDITAYVTGWQPLPILLSELRGAA